MGQLQKHWPRNCLILSSVTWRQVCSFWGHMRISLRPPPSGGSPYYLIKAGEGFHMQGTPVENHPLVVLRPACIECLLCSMGHTLRKKLKTAPVLTASMALVGRQSRDLVYSASMCKRGRFGAVPWSGFVLWKFSGPLWAVDSSSGAQESALFPLLGCWEGADAPWDVRARRPGPCMARRGTDHWYTLSSKLISGDRERKPASLEEVGTARSPELGQRGSSCWIGISRGMREVLGVDAERATSGDILDTTVAESFLLK